MNFEQLGNWSQLATSTQLTWIASGVSVLGILFAILLGFMHYRAERGGAEAKLGRVAGFLLKVGVPLTVLGFALRPAWIESALGDSVGPAIASKWAMAGRLGATLLLLGLSALCAEVLGRRRDGTPSEKEGPAAHVGLASYLPIGCMYVVLGLLSYWVQAKWVEVNHFPSQTMAEVLIMFCLAMAASMVVLHHALGMQRRGAGWAILDDVLMIGTFATIIGVTAHVGGLVTAQRDLPPALQSYWFPPHLAALIFSYATLAIAGLIAMTWFASRFWTAAFSRGINQGGAMLVACGLCTGLLFSGMREAVPFAVMALGMVITAVVAVLLVPRLFPDATGGSPAAKPQGLLFLCFALVPFVHVITLPVMMVTGLVFLGVKLAGRLPTPETMGGIERQLDDVSFRAFAVGMPFLTGGLWMGAFWAQEAWANYWGWDSKENSALITWLVYVVYIHLRLLGGYRGEKAMAVLMGGALSIFVTFQMFGYLPDSQKSLHRYTDDEVTPQEGMQGVRVDEEEARVDAPAESDDR